MELLELMKHRRAIRRFDVRQVDENALQKILEAGLYAPSAGGRQGVLFAAEDCACAAENMMLMADSLGVGSCYIDQGWTAFAAPYGQEILKKWAIRPDYYALMQLLLGYPKAGDAHPTPKPRKDGRILRF